MKKTQMILDVHEKPQAGKWIALSIQHLFAMFGATILVPLLTGLSPAVTLLASGVGTLAYLIITRGKIPAYLGSSFAFIVPIITVSQTQGVGEALFGCFLAGVVYGIVALVIFRFGAGWLHKLLPPVVIGSVVIVIGLALAATAVDMASTQQVTHPLPDTVEEFQALPGTVEQVDEDAGTVTVKTYSLKHFSVALATLAFAVVASLFFRGFLSLIPILVGITGGYAVAMAIGLVDFAPLREAAWLALPEFTAPVVSWTAALVIVPVALVTLAEHIGHLMVTSNIMDRDLAKDPGLHRSILGDGVATSLAALIGAPPNTTYGENIGVMAMTRIFSVFVIGGAATAAIAFSFVGKLSALISTIPPAVMGGVSILLFGVIASAGLRMMVENQIDFGDKRNLVIASVVLVIGVGGAALKFAGIHFEVEGMALATVTGILLNLILPSNREDDGASVEEAA
ncbi:solute carrier family 23 protein [Desmospora profundinema]|uniref:Uracil permease n=1 Tax=Desmospora profundinema TaxID=1571184 RepID=A0ABU1IJ41_9BACL|nr:solute carrier family 23 protein [Desmospora profundinema]MDR6224768.1 uracil permease [Desmospora profundinema]